MPVHSLFVIDRSCNNVLYTKIFDNSLRDVPGGPFTFETKLIEQTKQFWFQEWNGQLILRRSCYVDDIICVFEHFGELLLFICGNDDTDEFLLFSLLDTIKALINDILEEKQASTKDFLNFSNFGKFCLSIDDLMPDGIIETFDTDTIAKYSKLRKL